MRDDGYNLIKLLLSKLDLTWRLRTHYLTDAKKVTCRNCEALLERIRKDEERHAEAIREEIARHIRHKTLT